MSLIIRKSGVLDTFQDLGRNGFRQFGINPNGAMDKIAVRLINVLLGNIENEASLEMHFPACELEFSEAINFALGGADFDARLNDEPINLWQNYLANKGDLLKFSKKNYGNRCYLSVQGGFNIEKWLGSSSTNVSAEVGGFEGRKLQKNDRILYNQKFSTLDSQLSNRIAQSIIPKYSTTPTVRIVKGSEFQDLTALSEQELFSNNYKISTNSNRMGFRLEGKPLFMLNEKEIISTAVNFGTIQLLPDGQMIILMADHQTTGGYSRIAHIIEQDLSLVAQLGANDSLSFYLISHEDAEDVQIHFEKDLSFLKVGVKFIKNAKS